MNHYNKMRTLTEWEQDSFTFCITPKVDKDGNVIEIKAGEIRSILLTFDKDKAKIPNTMLTYVNFESLYSCLIKYYRKVIRENKGKK